MATSTANVLPTSATDADFRNWIAAIIAGITGVGWVQTGDTGQVNTATVTVGAVANTERGYAMFRTNDGVSNIYLRLGFTSGGTGNLGRPRMNIQVGTGTNGAGTLTGFVTGVVTPSNFVQSPAQTCYFSGTTSRLCVLMWHESGFQDATNGTWLISIERSRDASGNDTAVGFYVVVAYSVASGAVMSNFLTFAGPASGQESLIHGPFTVAATTVIGTTVAVFPCYPIFGAAQNPSLNLVSFRSGDITPDTVFTFTMYGATRTFVALRAPIGNGSNANMRLAMRYE